MSLPTMSGTGRLTRDIELRYSAKGSAVATLPLAFNSRRKDQDGNWVDGDTFYVRATAFGRLAENAAESFSKGQELVVAGRLKTDQWEDKQDGSNRSATALLLDSIGGSCGLDTVTVNRVDRSGGFGERRPTGTDGIQTNDDADPWGSAPPAGQPSADAEPPF